MEYFDERKFYEEKIEGNETLLQRLKLSGNQDTSDFPDSFREGDYGNISKLMNPTLFIEGRPGNAEQFGCFAHVAIVQTQGLRQHFFFVTFQFG